MAVCDDYPSDIVISCIDSDADKQIFQHTVRTGDPNLQVSSMGRHRQLMSLAVGEKGVGVYYANSLYVGMELLDFATGRAIAGCKVSQSAFRP